MTLLLHHVLVGMGLVTLLSHRWSLYFNKTSTGHWGLLKGNTMSPWMICNPPNANKYSGLWRMHKHNDIHTHDNVIKWKHFPRYWPFLRSPMNSPHKDRWCGALIFSLICAWINGWVNNREAGDLRRHRVHYDVTVMAGCPGMCNYCAVDLIFGRRLDGNYLVSPIEI